MAKHYDALVIGGGPAGLSAALALGRVHRTCAVFTTDTYRNDGAHAAHAIISRDHTPPSEIRRLGRSDIERYKNTDFINTAITSIIRKEAGPRSHFLAANDAGQHWIGRTVIMATGVRDQLPDLPGYKENWPHAIYQCPVCDGHERSHGPVGVLCYPEFSPMHAKLATTAHFLAQAPGASVEHCTKSNVTLLTNGTLDHSNPEHTRVLDICEAHHITVDQRHVIELEPSSDLPTQQPGLFVHLAPEPSSTSASSPPTSTRLFQSFLLHKPTTLPSSPNLISQLNLELTTTPFGTHIKTVPPMNSTNIPGVFVAGDAGVLMTQVTAAMATGNAAAGGVMMHVGALDDELALEQLRERRREKRNESEAVGIGEKE